MICDALIMNYKADEFGIDDIEIGNDEFRTPIHNPETMESNVENLYLAGVVCGGLKTNKWFIENSRIHAEVIMDQKARFSSVLSD